MAMVVRIALIFVFVRNLSTQANRSQKLASLAPKLETPKHNSKPPEVLNCTLWTPKPRQVRGFSVVAKRSEKDVKAANLL